MGQKLAGMTFLNGCTMTLSCGSDIKFYGYYNLDYTWREIPQLWKSLATKEKMIFNESVDFNIDLKHFSNLSYSKYRLEFVYSLKEFENTYNNSHELIAGANKIYSNEFTIKEKSALDMRCSERIIQFNCSNDVHESKCQGMKYSFEFDFFNTRKCFKRTIPCSCSFEPLFETLEECQEICERKINTSNWQIYQNEEFGFEIDYPKSFKSMGKLSYKKENVIKLVEAPASDSHRKEIEINKFKITENQTFKDIITENSWLSGGGPQKPNFSEFKPQNIGNNSFYYRPVCGSIGGTNEQGEWLCDAFYFYWLVNNDNVYEFNLFDVVYQNQNLSMEDSISHLEFKEILSTFKFID